ALRPVEAGEFMTDYTESLDKTLGDDGDGLDKIQAAPLIDRTRAQIQIADKADQKLRAPNFTEVVAGSPSFTDYPMWFYAFGTADEKSTDGDEQLTQVMLVTRESASAEPLVRSSSYIPTDQMPTLMPAHTRRAPPFTESVAGSPTSTDYPMWFSAFGPADEKSTDGDEQLTQVMLVTRESASAEPLVRSSSYIPTDQMPTLMADDAGA